MLLVAVGSVLPVGDRASAEEELYSSPILGEPGTATPSGQTLMDVARAYDLGYVELMTANPGVDPWTPRPWTILLLPTAHIPPPSPRRGIVVNLAEMRLYWYAPDNPVPVSFPVGLGREGWSTKPGAMKVVGKRVDPTWTVPASIRRERPELPAAVGPGPDNPLGAYSLDLSHGLWRIHGTNKPDSVGRRVSHGCLHLYPEDIERLFPDVPVGTPVTIVDQPVLLAWSNGELYLDVHPTVGQQTKIGEEGRAPPADLPDLQEMVLAAAGDDSDRIDWWAVEQVAAAHLGVPLRITRPRMTALGSEIR